MKLNRKLIRFVAGVCISAFFMWLVLRRVDWSQFWQLSKTADVFWLVSGVALLLFTYCVNALRWQKIFVGNDVPPVRTAFAFIMIGHMFNSFLPFRAGDLLRGGLLAKKMSISTAWVYGTMTLERLLDVAVLLVLALCVSRLAVLPPGFGQTVLLLSGCGIVAFLGLLLLLRYARLRTLALKMLSWTTKGQNLLEKVLANYLKGVRTISDGMRLLLVVGLSVLSWGLIGLVFIMWFRAFGLHVPWYAGYLIVVTVNLGSAIPSSPGFVGVYHYMVYLALSFWIDDQNLIASFAVVTHLLSMGLYAVVGGACFLNESLDFSIVRTLRSWLNGTMTHES